MRTIFATFATLCLGLAISWATATGASAAPQSSPAVALKDLTSKISPASPVTYYRHYCVRQYFKCRNRWDEGWRFRRCMKWRGCWEAYLDYRNRHDDDDSDDSDNSCSNWRQACSENWGYGTSDYYGCLKYHGCD